VNKESAHDRYVADIAVVGWLRGVVARMSDSRLAVVGLNPSHGIARFSEVGDRFFRGKLSRDVTTT